MNISGCAENTGAYQLKPKNKSNGDLLDKTGKILLFLCILMERNEYLAQLNWLQWPVLAMLAFILLICMCRKNSVINDFAFGWMILFTLYVSISFFWSFNPIKVCADIKYMIKAIIVLSYVLYSVKKDKSLDFVVFSIIFATLVNVAMIASNMVVSGSQIIRRADIIIGGVEINVNQVSPDIAFATLLLIYKMKDCRKRLQTGIYVGIMVLFITMICYLGSRVSLIVIVGGIMLSALTGSYRKIFKNCLVAIALVILIFILVMKVPFLYDAIGNRIEDTINLFMGNKYVSENQKSDSLRMQLIKNGWDMFKKRPLWGYGSGNYASLNKQYYDLKYYSHNNYIELLVNLGIVGVIVYYSFHIRMLWDVFRIKIIKRSGYINLAGQMVLCMLVLDITYVTYNVMNMWMYLLIGYLALYLEKHTKRR